MPFGGNILWRNEYAYANFGPFSWDTCAPVYPSSIPLPLHHPTSN